MKLKELFADDNAVSPVIGVILMVAITVILAAVIGTFVLGLGDQVQDTAPTASITFDQQGEPGDDAEIKISHDGGDSLSDDEISIVMEDADNSGGTIDKMGNTWTGSDEITAGDTIIVTEDDGSNSVFEEGDIVKVVWTSDSGESSSVLGEHEVN